MGGGGIGIDPQGCLKVADRLGQLPGHGKQVAGEIVLGQGVAVSDGEGVPVQRFAVLPIRRLRPGQGDTAGAAGYGQYADSGFGRRPLPQHIHRASRQHKD
jgi:hypothetical protein